jgi:multicomponent Na+:H+ antiporter subunit B
MSPATISLAALIAAGVGAVLAAAVLARAQTTALIAASLAAFVAAGLVGLIAVEADDAAAVAGAGLLGAGGVILLGAHALIGEPRASAAGRWRAAAAMAAAACVAVPFMLISLGHGDAPGASTPAIRLRLDFEAARATPAWLAGAHPEWLLASLLGLVSGGLMGLGLLGAGERAAPAPGPQTPALRPLPALRVAAKQLAPVIVLVAALWLFAPGAAPGAGFGAGALAGLAFILYGLVFGVDAARRAVPLPAAAGALAFGLALAIAALTAAHLAGGDVVDMRALKRWMGPDAGDAVLAPLTTAAAATMFGLLGATFLLIAGRAATLRDPT